MNVPRVAEKAVQVVQYLAIRRNVPSTCFRSLASGSCAPPWSGSPAHFHRKTYCTSPIARVEQQSDDQPDSSERPFFLKAKENKKSLGIKLDREQKKAILDQLNTRTFEELSKTKGIGKQKAEAMIMFRETIGPFSSLEQLHEVKGFGMAFFKALQENGQLPPVRKHNAKALETIGQLLSEQDKESITSLVSIDIGFQNAAWVHVSRDRSVLDWCHTEVPKPKPYNPAQFRPVVEEFAGRLPTADLYVVELQSHRIGKHAMALLPFVLHLRIFEAMLHCTLPGRVVPFNPNFTSRHFCLPIGRSNKKKAAINLVESLFLEKTNEASFENQCEQFLNEQTKIEGSQDFVSSIVDQSKVSTTESGRPHVQIPAKFIEYFKSCRKRDDLSDCLLQALAFYDLVVDSNTLQQ